MPVSSMARVQQAARMHGETPAAEVVWVQGHLDGRSSIPAAEVAGTKRWRRGKNARKAQLTQAANDILEVAELAEPLSYTLLTLGNGQEMWVPVGRDPQDYADEVAQKLGIVITPPPTAERRQPSPERPASSAQEASKAHASPRESAEAARLANRARYEELCHVPTPVNISLRLSRSLSFSLCPCLCVPMSLCVTYRFARAGVQGLCTPGPIARSSVSTRCPDHPSDERGVRPPCEPLRARIY